MARSSNRWLLLSAAGMLAIGLSACHKQPVATDTSNATADAYAAAPADNTNAMAPTNDTGTAPAQ
ncbi:MAG TPA: hypothetical protein VGH15_02715 [Caulobacteraceae bacterium]|jgi:hypothetical protein